MPTPEELQAQLEAAQKELEALKGKGGGGDLEAEMDKLRSINKELIEQRDAQKEKERKAEEERMTKQGEFEALAKQLQGEKETLAKQIEELTGKVGGYVERDEARFKELIANVPETMRGSIDDDSIPLAKRIELAEKVTAERPKAPGGRPPGDNHTDEDLSAMSPQQRLQYARQKGMN